MFEFVMDMITGFIEGIFDMLMQFLLIPFEVLNDMLTAFLG